MLIKYLIYAFMVIVLAAAIYQVFSGYLGAGRTGNYLKIRGSRDQENGYRILPVYKLILRRMRILYIIMLFLHIIFPLFFAFVFSVLVILSDKVEWWSRDDKSLRESVLLMWQSAGYSTWVFLCILFVAGFTLLLVNLLVFPIVFDIAVRLV